MYKNLRNTNAIMTNKKISSSFKNHFLECRASCKSARFKTRVKSSLSRQKLIFPQSGKIEECERETGLRHRSMKFGEDQMVRVHTCDGMYTHLCGWDKHASSHAKRMRGAWWPRTVHERVTPTERTLADWGAENRCTSARNSLGLLPMPCRWKVLSVASFHREERSSNFRPDQSSARTNGNEVDRVERWDVLFGVVFFEQRIYLDIFLRWNLRFHTNQSKFRDVM